MWTRGKDKADSTKFEFELFDGNQMIARKGGFTTAQEADRAAEQAQRDYLFPAYDSDDDTDDVFNMTDDELLDALGLS